MNTLLLSAALLLNPLFSTPTGGGEAERSTIDPATSSITWEGKKVTGSHNGDIQIQSGFIDTENGLITGATVIINMGTINTTDLEGGSKESLDGHLMSDDFFGVEQFPTAQFELTGINPVRAENGMNFVAQGTVTIKGRTAKVSFPVMVNNSKSETSISGEVVLDRSDFDVRFRSKSFFDPAELGDKLIYDDFTIGFSLKAK
ncbi:YceI family protein [Flavobacteriales bacterium]|nr:YceI family protein [Flavobacteriales bacterium]